MKKIEIIPLAKNKLERRGIPVEWIIKAVNYPEQVVDGYGGRKVAHKNYLIRDKKYLLRAVYEEKEEFIEIVTAYLTSQITRYWKERDHED